MKKYVIYVLNMTDFTTKNITAIYHSRKKFYGKPIYWFEFLAQTNELYDFTDLIPGAFLNVDGTVFYEFGGSLEESIKYLTEQGFVDIVEGDEL